MCSCCRYGITAMLAIAVSVVSLTVDADDKTRPAGDKYAGKTVRNGRDGMGLIRARSRNVPKVGQRAPGFALRTLDGKRTIKLSQYKGKQPVVLVFGSYT